MLNRIALTLGLAFALVAANAPGASAFPYEDVFATVALACEPTPGGTALAPTWHVVVDNNTAQETYVEIKIVGYQSNMLHFDPWAHAEYDYVVPDGVYTHISVDEFATNDVIVSADETPLCNQPSATIDFECSPTAVPSVFYSMTNDTDIAFTYEVQQVDGTIATHTIDAFYGYREEFAEDQAFDVYVAMNGQVLAQLSGIGDCQAPADPTTTTTSAPPATTTVAPTATVPPASAVVEVAGAHLSANTDAGPAAELPRTGAPSEVLTLVSIASMALGAIALTAVRRRQP